MKKKKYPEAHDTGPSEATLKRHFRLVTRGRLRRGDYMPDYREGEWVSGFKGHTLHFAEGRVYRRIPRKSEAKVPATGWGKPHPTAAQLRTFFYKVTGGEIKRGDWIFSIGAWACGLIGEPVTHHNCDGGAPVYRLRPEYR